MMERQQRHGGAKPDATGALRGRDCDHQRRRHDRKISEKMQLRHPGDVEAELVAEYNLLDGLLVTDRLGLFRGAGQLVEKTELHESHSFVRACSRRAGTLARLRGSLHTA